MDASIGGDVRLTGVVRPDGTFNQTNVAKSLDTDSDASWTDRHGPVEEEGPALAAKRIGNRFPPPPLFLHEPGRFEGTQVETSRLGGCRQTLDVERVRPQTTRRQLVTETRPNGFDSLRAAATAKSSDTFNKVLGELFL